MKTYVGKVKLQAQQMTRLEYNNYRNWKLPENENPNDEGYLIKYESGYVTWLIKSEFEKVYKEE
jgi:hypothetical protein